MSDFNLTSPAQRKVDEMSEESQTEESQTEEPQTEEPQTEESQTENRFTDEKESKGSQLLYNLSIALSGELGIDRDRTLHMLKELAVECEEIANNATDGQFNDKAKQTANRVASVGREQGISLSQNQMEKARTALMILTVCLRSC